jgi:hypothetical protein
MALVLIINGGGYERHDVVTRLNYWKDSGDGSLPKPIYMNEPKTLERAGEDLEVTVRDIRGFESEYSLDKTDFEIANHQSSVTNFFDEEQIKKIYYPEIEQLIQNAFVFPILYPEIS